MAKPTASPVAKGHPPATDLSKPLKLTLNFRELAEVTGYSRTTLWRMSRRGELPSPIANLRRKRWSVLKIREWLGEKAA
jgi:predicted DNA-binding transcriptional regulator AlpA